MEKKGNPKENAGGMRDPEDGKEETKQRTPEATGRTEVVTGRTGVRPGMREIRIKREDPVRETEKTKAKETLKEIPVIVVLTKSQRAKKRQRRKASGDSFPNFSASKPLLGS